MFSDIFIHRLFKAVVREEADADSQQQQNGNRHLPRITPSDSSMPLENEQMDKIHCIAYVSSYHKISIVQKAGNSPFIDSNYVNYQRNG